MNFVSRGIVHCHATKFALILTFVAWGWTTTQNLTLMFHVRTYIDIKHLPRATAMQKRMKTVVRLMDECWSQSYDFWIYWCCSRLECFKNSENNFILKKKFSICCIVNLYNACSVTHDRRIGDWIHRYNPTVVSYNDNVIKQKSQ
jgi:hypothetical protein